MSASLPLNEHSILGISSMIRDLSILTSSPERLEKEILGNVSPLSSSFFHELGLITGSNVKPRPGDVVLFKLKSSGAYPEMETLWGGRVRLNVGGEYLGVLCERRSTKLITGTIDRLTGLEASLELQLIAQAGGVGLATGFSPDLKKANQLGRASDVEIRGCLYAERTDRVLNISDASPQDWYGPTSISVPPTVMVIGTATDVGKTTTVCAVLRELSTSRRCAAIKATGTGWYEDSLLHAGSGAFPALNFTFVGLPTTYQTNKNTFLRAMNQLVSYVAVPNTIPPKFIHPDVRLGSVLSPELIMIEHGGDFISASIPYYLQDSNLMLPVRVLVICSESALGLIGTVEELRQMGIRNESSRRIYATVPLVNPEAFYNRVEPFLQRGLIEGILDVNKPKLTDEKERRCDYSAHYDDILSCGEFVMAIEHLLTR